MEKKTLNVVIIDDEKKAIDVLVFLLSQLSYFDIKIDGTATNMKDGVELIKHIQPDLVFLDISLPDKNGLEIYNEFESPLPFKLIFCTAHQQYAIDVIKKTASGYLLKPIYFMDLQSTLNKVSEELLQDQKQMLIDDNINALYAPKISGKNILLGVENGFIMCNTRNIEYCYANRSHSVLVTLTQKKIFVSESLKELQELLPEDQFSRIQKSFMVNIYYIQQLISSKKSYLLMESGVKIPLSVKLIEDITKEIKRKLRS
jgi:two-component system LytT family response regulator